MPPEQSSSSVKIISLNRDDLIYRLQKIAALLVVDRPEVAEVRLFGSLARGDQTGISDADILVVLHRSREKDPHRRALDYLPYFDLERGVDLLILTRAELEQHLAKGERFFVKVLAESVLLAG